MLDAAVERAVAALRGGGLVAFPTETVYGLGADASSPAAVRRIFAAKGRPPSHPLIVHLGDAGLVDTWAVDVPRDARHLADACWPGPLTLVLHRAALVPDEVTGGRETVGLRVPAQPLALAMLRRFGGGVAAPSANRFGRVSPTTAADVAADLGPAVDLILDGGPCTVGVESTIVDLTGPTPTVLRPGGIPVDALEAVLGRPVALAAGGESRAPGMLPSHYAPAARVELVAAADVAARVTALLEAGHHVAVLSEAAVALPPTAVALPPVGDAEGYARALYAHLRLADRLGADVVVAVPPAEVGIGAAVCDRLRKAAAPRDAPGDEPEGP
ncbi:MAG: threonylcarbamoyl-AMP synthase [Acidimicrobiales bacterium]|nr:threonylcarbamoyl-AMP synthase [Acidimicrobiales bacterium]